MADWKTVIPDFRAKVAQFMEVVARVENSRPMTAAQQAKKSALISVANGIRNTISIITKAIDAVANTFGLGTLGLVPLVPIAFVLASIAAMTKFISDAYIYLQQVEMAKTAQAQGATPEQVASILHPEVVSVAERLKANWIPWTLGAALVFLVLRKKAEPMAPIIIEK